MNLLRAAEHFEGCRTDENRDHYKFWNNEYAQAEMWARGAVDGIAQRLADPVTYLDYDFWLNFTLEKIKPNKPYSFT